MGAFYVTPRPAGVTATPDRFTAAVDTIGIAALASFLRHLPRSATRT